MEQEQKFPPKKDGGEKIDLDLCAGRTLGSSLVSSSLSAGSFGSHMTSCKTGRMGDCCKEYNRRIRLLYRRRLRSIRLRIYNTPKAILTVN